MCIMLCVTAIVFSYEVRWHRYHELWQARQLRDGRLVKSWLTDDRDLARERCQVWQEAQR
jgi:hypothetical protein